MFKSLSKLGMKIEICCLSFLTIALMLCTLYTPKLKAASSNIYYVTASVGETYETAGINYHCNLDGSYVIFSKSSSLTDTIKVEPTVSKWHIDQSEYDENTGFGERNVCKAVLTGLEADTTYYYQIICGSEKSNVYSFKTGGNNSNSSVLFLTDTQSSSTNYFQKIDNLVKKIESKEKNLNMVLITGDIVDRGGYQAQWDALFAGLPSLQKYQQATIPGNHEYYHDKNPEYIDASIYNQFYNNPQNGPEDRKNSSYYFIYNETLFIMLDILQGTKSGIDITAQKEWFRQVVQNNPTRWIIVGSHAGAVSAGAYASDAKYLWNNFHDVFEECQVDLCISGHEHIYIRKDLSYQGEKNEDLGVTYLVGPAAGMKDYAVQKTEGLDKVIRGNYRGQVLKFQGSTLTVLLYDMNGDVIEKFSLNAKRNAEVTEYTDKEILDSVECTYDESTESATFTWEPNIWGLVKEVSCTGDARWAKTVASCSELLATHTIHNVFNTNNYIYNINFLKKDGTTITKEIKLYLNKDLVPTSISVSGKRTIDVAGTTQLTAEVLPKGAEAAVTWSSANPEIATVDQNGLVTGVSAGKVRIYATSQVTDKVVGFLIITVKATSDPASYEITGLPSSITKDDIFNLSIKVSPIDGSKDATWTTSDPNIAVVNDGEVHITGYGTVTITVTSTKVPSVTASITFTSVDPSVPVEPSPGKTGCSSKTNIERFITFSSALGLVVILLRKKNK